MKKNELLILLAVVILAFFVLKGLRDSMKNFFATFGLGTSTETDAVDTQIEKQTTKNTKLASAWNPNFWKSKQKLKGNTFEARLMKIKKTDEIGSEIRNSIGVFYDEPEKTLAAFEKMEYQTQVSWLANRWAEKGHGDLYTYLNDKLDTAKQREIFLQIVNYVKNLPLGFFKPKE